MAFPETRWTILADATMSGDVAGQAALEELCRRYWPPVRDFLCGRGLSAQDAEDVAQEFFAGLMKSGGWHSVDRVRGKFRSFILGGVERTLADWRRKAGALKRGGGQQQEPLEAHEDSLAVQAVDERHFDAAWAERVLEVAMDSLERDFEEQGRGEEFGMLVPFLSESASQQASWATEANFPVTFVSDVAGSLGTPYDVMVERNGQKFMRRVLFVVGPDGRIKHVMRPFRELAADSYTELKAAVEKASAGK